MTVRRERLGVADQLRGFGHDARTSLRTELVLRYCARSAVRTCDDSVEEQFERQLVRETRHRHRDTRGNVAAEPAIGSKTSGASLIFGTHSAFSIMNVDGIRRHAAC